MLGKILGSGTKETEQKHENIGSGGELHQMATHKDATMTTEQGVPISDDQNSLKVGRATALEDHIFRGKIFHFDHERIPERVVHARGYGAHGVFTTYESLSDITCADLFQRAGEETPVFVRFSTVAGSKGSTDLARDVRGFATKFYTKEGNWDLVANNIPVFFIQDAIKFPDLVHSVKEEPDRAFPQAATAHDNFWDFISLMPESMHMIMWVMSDRAIPRSFRFMEGFGVHTFRFLNEEGKSKFVKFHWKPVLGLQSVTWPEALKISGADPDFHRRDLWDAISSGDFPEWELGLQIFDDEYARKFTQQWGFDVLDSTKIIPEEEVPIRRVGKLVLNRLPDNFFAETEQIAFCTQNIVKGIDFTDDPLLQGRNFSYLDTQLKRLGGPNFHHLPINAPRCPWANFQQDGHMAIRNLKGRVNYEPNSYGVGPTNPRESTHGFKSFIQWENGVKLRARGETFADHYSQARQFYVSQTEVERIHISNALIFELSKVENPAIRCRLVSHLLNIDEALAERVAAGLGLPELPKPAVPAKVPQRNLPPSPALSIVLNGPKSLRGRKVGVLFSVGADSALIHGVKKAAEAAGMIVELVSHTVGPMKLSDGSSVQPAYLLEAAPSCLFDFIVVIFSAEGAALFNRKAPAKEFVSDSFAHSKFIAVNAHAQPLLRKAVDSLDEGCFLLSESSDIERFFGALVTLRYWKRELVAEGKIHMPEASTVAAVPMPEASTGALQTTAAEKAMMEKPATAVTSPAVVSSPEPKQVVMVTGEKAAGEKRDSQGGNGGAKGGRKGSTRGGKK